MKISLKELPNHLQRIKNESSVFLLYGNNNGLVENAFSMIIKGLKIDKNNPFSCVKIDLNNVIENKTFISDEINTYSIFENQKNFILDFRDNNNAKILEELFKDILIDNDLHCRIIILGGSLKSSDTIIKLIDKYKYGFVIACYENDETYLEGELNKYLINNEIILNQDQKSNLLMRLSKDTKLNDNIFEKLNLISKSVKLNKNTLDYLIDDNRQADVNDLINYSMIGDYFKATNILKKCSLSRISTVFICRRYLFKINQLEKIFLLRKNGTNFDDILKNRQLKIFFKEKQFIINQVKIWNLNKINYLREKFIDIEINCKSKQDFDYLFLENALIYIYIQSINTLK